MNITTDSLFILVSIALSFLIFISSCILLKFARNSLVQSKELIKRASLFDEQMTISKGYALVSKQKQQEIDDALGLINIKTKINKELYIDTVARVMTNFDFVEQTAIRYIIAAYKLSQWINVKISTPEVGCNVWGYCEGTDDYLCVCMTSDCEWLIVEHDDNQITMPPRLVVTHWKHFDQTI